jgi:hypothetical protein
MLKNNQYKMDVLWIGKALKTRLYKTHKPKMGRVHVCRQRKLNCDEAI